MGVNKITIDGVTKINLLNTDIESSADIPMGKYGYLKTGELTLGTGQINNSSANVPSAETPIQIATGTVEGNGTNILQIPCDFEPDLIHIEGDLSADVATRGITTLTIIKDMDIYCGRDTTTSESRTDFMATRNITGYNESNTSDIHATYSNNTLSIDTVLNSGSQRWTSGITYQYKLIKFGSSAPSATAHTIHFAFTDNTNTDITAYYDNTFINSAITATIPSMYDNKTVTSASLDGTVWYQPASIPLNTELVDLTKVTSGKYIGDDGLEHDNEWVGATDYIRIDPTMTFNYLAYQWFYIGFYDSSKDVISTIYVNSDMDSVEGETAHGTLTPIKIPANAIYVRLSGALGSGNEYLSLIRTA